MMSLGRLLPFLSRLNFRRIEECSTIIKWLNPGPGERILDIGSGDGSYDWQIARSGASVVGVDLHEKRMATARRHFSGERTQFLLADAETIRLPDASFDKAVSLCVIEHLSRDEVVMANVSRALKPGGRFVFSADSLSIAGLTPAERERHRTRYAVNTFYTLDIVREKLARSGFEVTKANYILSSPADLKLFQLSWKLDDLRGAMTVLRTPGYAILGIVWALVSRLPGYSRRASVGGMTLLVDARKIA